MGFADRDENAKKKEEEDARAAREAELKRLHEETQRRNKDK
jgi:hypothetical protein